MSTSTQCPKCNYSTGAAFSECPRCGIIVEKFLRVAKENRQDKTDPASGENADTQVLADAGSLMVRQKKEWGEILTGIETKNRYEVLSSANNAVMEVEEEGGSAMEVMTRLFLKSLRPFTMNLFSPQGAGLYKLTRPFRFYFHEVSVSKSNGQPLGSIKRRFSILRRIYTVLDRNGREIYELFGPLLHPWTFQIRKGEQELGKITKKWSGLAKESFTDADNFGILFPRGIGLSHKAILLGAVFLIDFVHFENSGNRN